MTITVVVYMHFERLHAFLVQTCTHPIAEREAGSGGTAGQEGCICTSHLCQIIPAFAIPLNAAAAAAEEH